MAREWRKLFLVFSCRENKFSYKFYSRLELPSLPLCDRSNPNTHASRIARSRTPLPFALSAPALSHTRTMEAPLSQQQQQPPTQSQQLAMTANEEEAQLQEFQVDSPLANALAPTYCALAPPSYPRLSRTPSARARPL